MFKKIFTSQDASVLIGLIIATVIIGIMMIAVLLTYTAGNRRKPEPAKYAAGVKHKVQNEVNSYADRLHHLSH